MTKAELLADIAAKADGEVLSTNLVETVGDVNRYITNVFTTGQDADAGPIAQKRNVNWYVYDEGGAGEAAYYGDRNWRNPESKNATGSTLEAMSAIFGNQALRDRTKAAMLKAAFDVLNEDAGTNNHANRVALAAQAFQAVDTYVDAFMASVANNATVQSAGGAATDNDLQYIVNSNWDAVANAVVG